MKIYYAHHQWKYNTPIEEYEIGLIRKAFPDATIVNPNTDIKQGRDDVEIMADCIALVESCGATAFSSMDGVIGKGVFDEVGKSKVAYYIFNNAIAPFTGSFEIIRDSTTKRLYATVRMEG